MNIENYLKIIEKRYGIKINKNLRNIIEEYFEENQNIYTEQSLYKTSPKFIQYRKYK